MAYTVQGDLWTHHGVHTSLSLTEHDHLFTALPSSPGLAGGSLPSRSCFIRVFGFQQIPRWALFLLRQEKGTEGRSGCRMVHRRKSICLISRRNLSYIHSSTPGRGLPKLLLWIFSPSQWMAQLGEMTPGSCPMTSTGVYVHTQIFLKQYLI